MEYQTKVSSSKGARFFCARWSIKQKYLALKELDFFVQDGTL